MNTLVLNLKDSKKAELILKMAESLGGVGRILSKEEQRDLFLGSMMKRAKTVSKVSKEEILEKLRK